MVRARSQECERVRASVSAALDGELSEFESLLVRAHLGRCDTCREFEASAQLSTTALRAAPLEPLSRPLALPSRRRRGLGLRVPTMLKAYDASTLPDRPGLLRRAWVRFGGGAGNRVETAAPAKPPRPPVGIAGDAEGLG